MRTICLLLFLGLLPCFSHSQTFTIGLYGEGKFFGVNYDSVTSQVYYGINGLTVKTMHHAPGYDTVPKPCEWKNCKVKTLNYFFESEGFNYFYDGKHWAIFTPDLKPMTGFDYDWVFRYSPKYDGGREYWQPLFLVRQNGKYGLLNSKGKMLVPAQYDIPMSEKPDWFSSKATDTCHLENYRDCMERLLYKNIFRFPMIGTNMILMQNGKCGGVDTVTGKVSIPFVYDEIEIWKGASYFPAVLHKNGTEQVNLLTEKNGVIAGCDAVDYSNTGIYRVVKKNRYGFMDASGKEIIPCIYDDADSDVGTEDGNKEVYVYKGRKAIRFIIYPDGRTVKAK